MSDKINELQAVLNLPEEKQLEAIKNKLWTYKIITPQNAEEMNKLSLADLAFKLNDGSLAGKRPIDWVVHELIKKIIIIEGGNWL